MSMTTESTPTGGRDVWERWLVAWHALFVASLVFTTASGLAQGDLTGSRPIIAVVILAALSVGYWLIFMRQRPWLVSGRVAVVYLLVVAALFAVLLRQSTAYFWLQPIIFSQVFWLTDVKRAIPLAALVWLIVVQYSVDLSGRPLGDQLGELIGPAIAIAFFVIFGAWIGAIVRQSEDRRELLERLAATRAELVERERETVVLEERERLSRELHDTLAQDLVSVVTHLQAADAATDPAIAAHHRAEAARMAHDGIAETRRLVWALRPAALEDGTLVETLQRTVERWRVTSGIRAALTVTGAVRALLPDVEVALLRTVQEGLANAGRHAGATEVTVTLSYLDDVVTLDVHDDGRGFEPDEIPGAVPPPTAGADAADGTTPALGGAGLGLRGMRERVERLGGSVAIESARGEGTTVGVSLPAGTATGA